ncbi:MAG: hypothetical protein AAB557_02500 [Patescibacteria group bacterium]
MSTESPLVNKTTPRKATLDEVLEEERAKIVGKSDPDEYLKRDADPSPAQRADRDNNVKHPERLN